MIDHIQKLSWVFITIYALTGCVFDLIKYRIPNLFTGFVLMSGLVWQGFFAGWGGLADGLVGVICLAAPFILLYIIAGGGAGDAKLMGGLGAWLGLHNGLWVLISVIIAGGILGICFCLSKRRGREVLHRIGQLLYWFPYVLFGAGRMRDRSAVLPKPDQMVKMPYGLAIFVGSCVAAVGVNVWHW